MPKYNLENQLRDLQLTVDQQQHTINRLTATKPASEAPRTDAPSNEFFYGRSDENFLLWVDRFNRLAQANGWDDKRKRLTIPTCFRGFAELAYNAIPLDIRTEMKFNDLVERLTERFVPADNAELKGYLLHNRRQGTSEPVLTYALEIQQLTLEAYPDVSATTLDTLMKRFFIDGTTNCGVK